MTCPLQLRYIIHPNKLISIDFEWVTFLLYIRVSEFKFQS